MNGKTSYKNQAANHVCLLCEVRQSGGLREMTRQWDLPHAVLQGAADFGTHCWLHFSTSQIAPRSATSMDFYSNNYRLFIAG